MVAGQRTGKTAFLRLLLDTSDISPSTSPDKLASVAKFIQGCAGPTSHIRTVSVDVDLDPPDGAPRAPVTLTLVDTPSLDVRDPVSSERVMGDILRHVDSKFAESIEDDYKARTGDHHVHLCIYFLDPDHVVPPSAPTPPVPLVPRPRTGSISLPDPEPVILEPPVTTNPLLCRPTLPLAEISVIRALSTRVNVLPIVARADTLTNDRLAAIKMAIRRDLAEAGIGFGIFDLDNPTQYTDGGSLANGDAKIYGVHLNGSAASSSSSSPTSPITPSFLRLPYALISPDIYSHSDGVTRPSLSRHELVLQYTPSTSNFPSSPAKLVRGKFLRSYRWGSLDVLDHNHSDFLALRQAVFHHMQTLQKYTREYLFDKFRMELIIQQQQQQQQQRPASRDSISSHLLQSNPGPSQLPSLSSRPILTIDAHPIHPTASRRPSDGLQRQLTLGGDSHGAPPPQSLSDSGQENAKGSSKTNRQRAKKITVACNFCRCTLHLCTSAPRVAEVTLFAARKLKCDGGRPACHQCLKRNNPCDYMAPAKRRGGVRRRPYGNGNSDSEGGSGDERSVELEPSQSPEVLSKPLIRVDAADAHHHFAPHPPSRDEPPLLPPLAQPQPQLQTKSEPLMGRGQGMLDVHERPALPPLALPPGELSMGMHASAPPMLPPIRPPSDEQAPLSGGPPTSVSAGPGPAPQTPAQRRRASTASGKGNRASSNYGPKVVACNYCRARKTKCDGTHPTCSSCARRSLACNYVNDPGAPGGPSRRKSSNAVSEPASASTSSNGQAGPASGSVYNGNGNGNGDAFARVYDGEEERELGYREGDDEPPTKRIRIEGGSASSPVAVLGIP
ncbi:hypothetical protein FA95DRAFT_1487389 [Auriscalpium vulgare]|uniref:Uncharacterized protein n=1 Tax=Auriscalpium vulgare TaxID=40419 RepID=A0ACB8S280_9AGAM|nr:hypothetical protein FA95DRAFT_1487389 [Auriscalpium vulgare]